jgi:hypothetical protein
MAGEEQKGSDDIHVEGDVGPGTALGRSAKVEAGFIAGRDINIGEIHCYNEKPDKFNEISALSQKELDGLTDRLLKCPSMKDKGPRDAIIKRLKSAISDSISRDTRDRVDVRNIVETCSNYASGIKDLIDAIYYYEGDDSLPMREVYKFLPELKSGLQNTSREPPRARPEPRFPVPDDINQILYDIEQKFGYNWMFVTLHNNVIRYRLNEDASPPAEWLLAVRSLPGNSTTVYGWQLLCLDKQIQLIGVQNMSSEFMSLFFEKFPSADYDAPRFFRFASLRVQDQIKAIASGSKILIQKQNLARYVNLLNQTISYVEELEKELAGIRFVLSMFDCLANEDDEILPQEEIDYCLSQLKKHLNDSVRELSPAGASVMVRIDVENRLEQLKERDSNYRKWLMNLANNIENTRKHVFSLS